MSAYGDGRSMTGDVHTQFADDRSLFSVIKPRYGVYVKRFRMSHDPCVSPRSAPPWHFLLPPPPVRVWENALLFYVGPLAQNTQGPSSGQLHPPQGKLL